MDCRKIQEELSFYMDGILLPDEAEVIREHLATCAACQSELTQLILLGSGLREIGSNIHCAPAALRDNVMRQLREEAAAKPAEAYANPGAWWKRSMIGVAAAAVLTVGAFSLVLPSNQVTPEVAQKEPQPASRQPADTDPKTVASDPVLPVTVASTDPVETVEPAVNVPQESEPAAKSNSPVELPAANPAEETKPVDPGLTDAPNSEEPENTQADNKLSNPLTAVLMNSPSATSEQTLIRIAAAGEADPMVELDKIATHYQTGIIALGEQAVNGKQYIVRQMTVNRTQTEEVLAALGEIGEITGQQTDPIDLSAEFNDLFEQLLQVDKKLKETNITSEERASLTTQQAELNQQMQTLQKQADETVIIIWIEK